jgi:thiol-disulfide isomerase/thioredoxin
MDATQPAPAERKPTAARSWISLLVLVAAILVYVAVVGGPRRGPMGTEGPSIGRHLPYLQLEPLTGDSKAVSLDDLAGRVTLLNYWGTWCPPCIREFPEIVQLGARFAARPDFRLYAVSCGGEGNDSDLNQLAHETRQFLESNRVELPTYADRNAASRRAMTVALDLAGGQMAYPTTIVLDRDSTIRGLWQGYDPRAAREMAALIESLLAASPADRKGD